MVELFVALWFFSLWGNILIGIVFSQHHSLIIHQPWFRYFDTIVPHQTKHYLATGKGKQIGLQFVFIISYCVSVKARMHVQGIWSWSAMQGYLLGSFSALTIANKWVHSSVQSRAQQGQFQWLKCLISEAASKTFKGRWAMAGPHKKLESSYLFQIVGNAT